MSLENIPRDIITSQYNESYLPSLLKDAPLPGMNIVVVRTSPNSGVRADQWIIENYGLKRYSDVGIPVEVVCAWENQEVPLTDNSVILTTGSIVDLAEKDKYPWIARFRETVLRRAITKGLPVIAPCYGLAELATLYSEPGQDSFPKGIRELGRASIQQTSQHPVFNGIQSLTGYVHHNGTVPLEIIRANEDQIQIHAVSQVGETTIPAAITFGNQFALGTSFHREILDPQTLELYGRAVNKVVNRVVNSPVFKQHFAALKGIGILPSDIDYSNVADYLRKTSIDQKNVGSIQNIIAFLNQTTGESTDITWVNDYLQGTTHIGAEGYDQRASKLFFDNLLRSFIHQRLGLDAPILASGEQGEVITRNGKIRTHEHAIVRRKEILTVELAGTSDGELQDLDMIYRHGFGEHLPMSLDEHKNMINNGDTIVIRNAAGEITAVRAMVYAAEDSLPFDKHVEPRHAYQNHTVVRTDYRGSGLVEELTQVAIKKAREKGKKAILTSVHPGNIANLTALTRQGYRVIKYSPDHFGPEEDRVMLELQFDKVNSRKQEYFNELIQSGHLSLFDGSAESSRYLVHNTDAANIQKLLDWGYTGVAMISDETSYIVMEKNDVTDLPYQVRELVMSDKQGTSKTELTKKMNEYLAEVGSSTAAAEELQTLLTILDIDFDGLPAQWKSIIYQITYAREDEAGVAPTVENGLLPHLENAVDGKLFQEILASSQGPVLLLGCSTEGSLRAGEKLGEMSGHPLIIADRDPQALDRIKQAKGDLTVCVSADLTAPGSVPGENGIAVSDFVHSFIPRKKWRDFHINIATSLKENGAYLGAVYVYDSHFEDDDVCHQSNRWRADRLFQHTSQRLGTATSQLISDLAFRRFETVFPSQRTRENNFQGIVDVAGQLADVGLTLGYSHIDDLPHVRGTGLRRLIFVARKN